MVTGQSSNATAQAEARRTAERAGREALRARILEILAPVKRNEPGPKLRQIAAALDTIASKEAVRRELDRMSCEGLAYFAHYPTGWQPGESPKP